MKTITFLRHSETTGNKRKMLMGGRLDFPLTDNGKEIAQRATKEVKKYQFDKIYCSNNQRAKDTLAIIFPQPQIEVICTDAIKEQDYGKITGMNIDELPADHQSKFLEDPFYFPHEGGESLNQVKVRATSFFQNILEKSSDKSILLLTHENIIRAAIAYMKKLDREVSNLKFGYCSLTQYEYEEGIYKSVFFNKIIS